MEHQNSVCVLRMRRKYIERTDSLGLSNTIRVVDKLEDGNVDFYFNHNSTAVQSVSVNDDKVAIGLFHQDLIDPAIVEEMKNRYGNEYYGLTRELDNAYELTGYNHCFFGHIHTAYGIWKAGDVYLHYLASLGRTNEREVNDSMLERNIPCIVVEDDRFVAIEDNFVVLPDRKTCISESNVIENRQEYQERKTVRELRDYVPIADDPVKVRNAVVVLGTALKQYREYSTTEDSKRKAASKSREGLDSGSRDSKSGSSKDNEYFVQIGSKVAIDMDSVSRGTHATPVCHQVNGYWRKRSRQDPTMIFVKSFARGGTEDQRKNLKIADGFTSQKVIKLNGGN